MPSIVISSSCNANDVLCERHRREGVETVVSLVFGKTDVRAICSEIAGEAEEGGRRNASLFRECVDRTKYNVLRQRTMMLTFGMLDFIVDRGFRRTLRWCPVSYTFLQLNCCTWDTFFTFEILPRMLVDLFVDVFRKE